MSAGARGNAARVAVSSRFAAAPLRCAPSGDTATRAAKSVPVAGSRLPATSDPQSTPRIDACADSNYRHQLHGIPDPEPKLRSLRFQAHFLIGMDCSSPYWNGLFVGAGAAILILASGFAVRRIAPPGFGLNSGQINPQTGAVEWTEGQNENCWCRRSVSLWLAQCLAPSSGEGRPSGGGRPALHRAARRAAPSGAAPARARRAHRGLRREDAPDGAHGGRDALPPPCRKWSRQASRRSRRLRTAMRHVRQIQKVRHCRCRPCAGTHRLLGTVHRHQPSLRNRRYRVRTALGGGRASAADARPFAHRSRQSHTPASDARFSFIGANDVPASRRKRSTAALWAAS